MEILQNGQDGYSPMQQLGQFCHSIYHETQNMSLVPENIQQSQLYVPMNSNKVPSNVLSGEQCKQTVYTTSTMNESVYNDQGAALWVTIILRSLDSRLQGTETQLLQQNSRWQQIDQQLQNQNAQLQSQNTRMTQIEQNVEKINEVKQKVSNVEVQICNMDTEIDDVKSKITAYNDSIEHFNEIFDDIVSENTSAKSTIDGLTKRITHLELGHDTIKSSQLTMEGKVLDLQCRSVHENLLFTGIDEVEPEFFFTRHYTRIHVEIFWTWLNVN